MDAHSGCNDRVCEFQPPYTHITQNERRKGGKKERKKEIQKEKMKKKEKILIFV